MMTTPSQACISYDPVLVHSCMPRAGSASFLMLLASAIRMQEKEKQAAEAAAKAAAPSAVVPAGVGANGGSTAAPAAGSTAAVVDAATQRARDMDRVREDPYAAMLQARAALEKNSRWVCWKTCHPIGQAKFVCQSMHRSQHHRNTGCLLCL